MSAIVTPIDSARTPLAYALRYAERGWHVLPLLPGRKVPHGRLVPNGHNDATCDPATIRRWWALAPDANVGIQCSTSGIVAIDIDPRNGGLETLAELELEHGEIPADVMQLTPNGGQHRLLAASSRAPLPGTLGHGIDVKWDGYIVAEPSVLEDTGRGWSWEASSDPLHGAAPPPMPEWIRSARPTAKAPAQGALMPMEQVAEIRSALAVLDADDRDMWVRVGMALHATGGGAQAYGLWAEWSQQSEKFDAADQARVWRSFTHRGLDGLSLAYVFKAAQEAGWLNPRSAMASAAQAGSQGTQAASIAPILVPLDESGPIRPMPQIIRGILPADAVGMVWGAPGSYKSFLALDWALCIASGQEWLGHQVKQGTVWYLAGEGQAGLRHRVQAWRQARNYRGSVDFLHSQRAVLLDAEHGHSPGMAALLALIASGQAPDLIVVDTLARSMAGDESATRDASRYVAALDELVAAVRRSGKNCTVILIHHSRKDGDVYRGSSALRGAADFEFEMDATGGAFSVRLACRKVKDNAMPPTFYLRLEAEMLGTAIDDFGVEVAMTSLAIWMDRAPQEQSKAHEKAAELMRHLRPLLTGFPAGRSQSALTAALHEAGARFDKTYLPGFIELLAEQGELVIEYGARNAKLIRLASNDLPDLPDRPADGGTGGGTGGGSARPGKRT